MLISEFIVDALNFELFVFHISNNVNSGLVFLFKVLLHCVQLRCLGIISTSHEA